MFSVVIIARRVIVMERPLKVFSRNLSFVIEAMTRFVNVKKIATRLGIASAREGTS
jgi:hypothetical protein